ncbi:MAG: IS1634 family transposase, partial [Clostridia bacterium]|nr:IS1634 family transposase [Clostridia bacterium]
KRYKFEYDLSAILSSLIYGRILIPRSKLGTYEYLQRFLEPAKFQLQDIYRALEVIAKENDYLQASLYKFSARDGKRNDRVLYYDCTNYYFEIENESGIRKYGVSKENRPNPIVQMGLFMDGDGIPLAFCINAGNTNEQTTLKPLEQKIIKDFEHSKFVVCTDAGISSISNRIFNSNANRAFITTQSIKKMKGYQKEWALAPEGWRLPGRERTYDINKVLASEELFKTYHEAIFYKERWFNEGGLEQRYIISFSIKYMIYSREVRNEQIRRAREAISSSSIERTRQTDYKRFIVKTAVTADGEAADTNLYAINDKKILEEERYDGFYAIATCLEDSAEDIIQINRGRWEIEECFRIMKSEFKARPVYLSRDDRIKAHFTICFLALIVFRFLERRLGGKYTCREIIDGLRSFVFQHIPGDGYVPAYMRTEFTDAVHEAFGFRTDYEILPYAQLKKLTRSTHER